MTRSTRAILVAVLMTASLLLLTDCVTACPMCANALSEGQGGSGGNIVAGFYYSIVFMLSVPYLLLAGFGVMFYRLTKRASRTAEQEATVPTAGPSTALAEPV